MILSFFPVLQVALTSVPLPRTFPSFAFKNTTGSYCPLHLLFPCGLVSLKMLIPPARLACPVCICIYMSGSFLFWSDGLWAELGPERELCWKGLGGSQAQSCWEGTTCWVPHLTSFVLPCPLWRHLLVSRRMQALPAIVLPVWVPGRR